MKILEAIHILRSLPAWFAKNNTQLEQARANELTFREAQSIAENPRMYRYLSADDGNTIAHIALELFDAGFQSRTSKEGFQYLPYLILTNLASVVPGALEGVYPALLQRNLAWGSNAFFRGADSSTRDKLITLLEKEQPLAYQKENLLCALAWIGDDIVQKRFHHWQQQPPTWSSQLSIPTERYTLEAHWELTLEGRRNLYTPVCFDLVDTQYSDGPLQVTLPQEERCSWCQRSLMTLFDLDLRDSRITTLGIHGTRLRIPICLNCSLQLNALDERVFMDVDTEGLAMWSPINGQPPETLKIYQPDDTLYYITRPFPQKLILGDQRPTPYESEGAHLGGCPEWPQSADYPTCPVCHTSMMFVGQCELKAGYFEGFLYAFLCLACGKATIGQQH